MLIFAENCKGSCAKVSITSLDDERSERYESAPLKKRLHERIMESKTHTLIFNKCIALCCYIRIRADFILDPFISFTESAAARPLFVCNTSSPVQQPSATTQQKSGGGSTLDTPKILNSHTYIAHGSLKAANIIESVKLKEVVQE